MVAPSPVTDKVRRNFKAIVLSGLSVAKTIGDFSGGQSGQAQGRFSRAKVWEEGARLRVKLDDFGLERNA